MIQKNEPGVKPGPELLDDAESAHLCGISRRSVRRLTSAGDFPQPIKMAGLRATRWRRSDLMAWIEAGCPEGGGR